MIEVRMGLRVKGSRVLHLLHMIDCCKPRAEALEMEQRHKTFSGSLIKYKSMTDCGRHCTARLARHASVICITLRSTS